MARRHRRGDPGVGEQRNNAHDDCCNDNVKRTAFFGRGGRWRGRELLLPSQPLWQSKEAHHTIAGLAQSAGRGVLQVGSGR